MCIRDSTSIIKVFGRLESSATMMKLQQLMQYVKDTWIDSAMCPPATWSVYCQPARTNDAEGWHHWLNSRAHHRGPNINLLFSLLKHEADMVAINDKMLSDRKVRKCQCYEHSSRSGKTQQVLDGVPEWHMGGNRLLNACSWLYAPKPQQQN